MRRLHRPLLAAALALACTAAATAGDAAAKSPAKPLSILFLLQSQGAKFVKAPGLASYRVTFTGTSETVYGFTDRPNRMADHATLERFVTTWMKSDFVSNPPNAAMVLTKAEGGDTVVIAVLSHPRWNKAKHTLSFDAKLLRDISSLEFSLYDDAGKTTLPEHVTRAKIFVDSAGGCPTQAEQQKRKDQGQPPLPAPLRCTHSFG